MNHGEVLGRRTDFRDADVRALSSPTRFYALDSVRATAMLLESSTTCQSLLWPGVFRVFSHRLVALPPTQWFARLGSRLALESGLWGCRLCGIAGLVGRIRVAGRYAEH